MNTMRRNRRLAALATGLLAAGLIAGCSSGSNGPGVANVGSSTPAATSSSGGSGGSGRAGALAYSQCMRAHGVPDFPDPGGNGQIRLQAGPGSDLNPNGSRFKAAQLACKSLQPTGSAQQQAQARANGLKYSQCMRAHGIPDFPDPNPQGGLQISMSPGSDLNPDSPRFAAAQRACQKLMPGGGLDGGLNKGSGS
jgi:hypothetical protein